MRDSLVIGVSGVSGGEACSGRALHEGVAAVAAMDEGAFQLFYRRTAGPLRTYIARVVGDLSLADDMTQETYLRFLRSTPRIDDPQQLRAFLFRIASNLIVDHWRKRGRERDIQMKDEDKLPMGTAGPDIPLRLDMARVFGRLRPQERQLLWLAYVEGADHREIASALGLRERSVRVLLHRARRKLAQLIGFEQGGGESGGEK